jgi:hypothetical protein
MRWFIIAAALALGLVTLWAASLPLTAQPVPATSSPAMSKALFLCRTHKAVHRLGDLRDSPLRQNPTTSL